MRNRISATRWLILSILVLGSATILEAQTYTFSTLYSFKNNGSDPAFPQDFPTVDASGNVYGTSQWGGSTECSNGCGTVFKVTQAGALSVLHDFGQSDGAPLTGLVRDNAGNLYGTTQSIAFKLTPTGNETVLHTFGAGASDGFSPNTVTLDSAGNLYGTAQNGGSFGAGVIFKIDTSSTYSVLYNFCPDTKTCADGDFPIGRLVRDASGNLYGTTVSGGANSDGAVFKLTPSGVESVLHSFDGNDDGRETSGLTQDKQGNLYGVNALGGAFEDGTLFKQPESGATLTTLHSFCSLVHCADGDVPNAPVQLDSAGNIYGTAIFGPGNMGSVIWELTATGKIVVLHTFAKGVQCVSGLAIDSAGNLYGFTDKGGTSSRGSVFKLTLAK